MVMDYEHTLAGLLKWAHDNDDVRALVLTGSGGSRTAHPLSDRDINLYTTNVEGLVSDESWWERLGEVLVVERLENPDGDPTRLVYYAGGKLDFTLIAADRLKAAPYDRPYEVLLDKDGHGRSIRDAMGTSAPPTQNEFDEAANWGYAAALMLAKALVREELWAAKFRDNDLKVELLRIIEWDHQARYGHDYDTRYLGTRMNEWMDPDVREALHGCWGHLDTADSASALRKTLLIFAELASRLATSYEFVDFDHVRLREEIESIFALGDL